MKSMEGCTELRQLKTGRWIGRKGKKFLVSCSRFEMGHTPTSWEHTPARIAKLQEIAEVSK